MEKVFFESQSQMPTQFTYSIQSPDDDSLKRKDEENPQINK